MQCLFSNLVLIYLRVIAPTEHEMVPGWATIKRDGVATRYPPDPAKLFINTTTSRDLFTSLKKGPYNGFTGGPASANAI